MTSIVHNTAVHSLSEVIFVCTPFFPHIKGYLMLSATPVVVVSISELKGPSLPLPCRRLALAVPFPSVTL
jgi:hypothetical protein